MGRTIRAALYARVSTTHDQNPELQIEALRRYCEANEWRVTHEIIDRISGATDDRPGLKRLMTLARSRDVDAILVVRLDRLFRNLKHLITTLDEITNSLNINFVSLKESVNYQSASGKMFVQLIGMLSEYERAIISDRVRMGIYHARSKGKILGRPKKRDDEAILELRRQGLSYKQIARKLQITDGAVYRALKPTLKNPPERPPSDPDRVERFDG